MATALLQLASPSLSYSNGSPGAASASSRGRNTLPEGADPSGLHSVLDPSQDAPPAKPPPLAGLTTTTTTTTTLGRPENTLGQQAQHGPYSQLLSMPPAALVPGRDEHMLRRKTPNGILPASYDGSHIVQPSRAPPARSTVYQNRYSPTEPTAPSGTAAMPVMPAQNLRLAASFQKHALNLAPEYNASLSQDINGLSTHQFAFSDSLRQQQQQQQHHHLQQQHLSPLPYMNIPPQNAHSQVAQPISGLQTPQQIPQYNHTFSPGGHNPYSIGPQQYPATLLDSLLSPGNVVLQHNQSYPQYWGAMAPTMQNALGPTMLNFSGQLAPGWPSNGHLNPFQPAALRDARYQGEGIAAWSRQATNNYLLQQQQQQQQQQLQLQHQIDPHHQAMLNIANPSLIPGQSQFSFGPQVANPFVPSSYHIPIAGLNNLHHHVHSADVSSLLFHQSVPGSLNPNDGQFTFPNPALLGQIGASSATQLSFPSQTEPVVLAPSTMDGPMRDRVFSWAHTIYLDLLKNEHLMRKTNNETSKQKPSVFPKPPKLPASASALMDGSIFASSFDLSDKAISTYVSPASAWAPNQMQYQLAANPMDTASSWEEMPLSAATVSDGSAADAKWKSWNEKLRELKRASVISANNLFNSSQMYNPSNPALMALRDNHIQSSCNLAVSILNEIILDGSWKWIEGILLAGCLAYGLLDFPNALKMYKTVLEIDSGHVEAMSNLAATYLAMDRKDEAVQCWQQAIRLRPNYFDASEHLIGLLCNMGKAKEAITIIRYIEESLRCDTKPPQSMNGTGNGTEPRDGTAGNRNIHVNSRFGDIAWSLPCSREPGFAETGYAVAGCDVHRLVQLIHAKGNMLYTLGDTSSAADTFETAVLIATGWKGRGGSGVRGLVNLVKHICHSVTVENADIVEAGSDPILIPPDRALNTAQACFPSQGVLPGFRHLRSDSSAHKSALGTSSNALLSLAKILQDGAAAGASKVSASYAPVATTGGILALYYLSLSLQPSPSTANNVGILLAGLGQVVSAKALAVSGAQSFSGIAPGSGASLALQYYWYGLRLDGRHAHLYTNLGSLLKDAGQLEAAVRMYEQAVQCDSNFDIALANLANAVKDLGRVQEAIGYYSRAVKANPDFAEAVCGLANALGAVCGWAGRGGSAASGGRRDRWHVGPDGRLSDAREPGVASSGWLGRVVALAGRQLQAGEYWGKGVTQALSLSNIKRAVSVIYRGNEQEIQRVTGLIKSALESWSSTRWEGSNVTIMIERLCKQLLWRWYRDKYIDGVQNDPSDYRRLMLPSNLSPPSTPTVLPFHAFTCPLSARQIRLISQRHGLRVSVTTLQSPWMMETVSPPPAPPSPALRVGYVSSDFNNHPLAHLMQSVFGMHDKRRVIAVCYATTPGDGSIHRNQIEREAPIFHDASSWSADQLIQQIVRDGIHILVNLNGYTRGARNEVFAARPAPIQMAFMGFAGTLGAEWCDYLLADETAVPMSKRRPFRQNMTVGDLIESETFADPKCEAVAESAVDENASENSQASALVAKGEASKQDLPDPSEFDQTPDDSPEGWIYAENIIYSRDTFFCCDHRQSAPDAAANVPWPDEQARRLRLRRQLFPHLAPKTLILGNFNQLYKLDPTTFRSWLRILASVPNCVLWLLRFPNAGEVHLRRLATLWAGKAVESRIIFTDVAPKQQHIARARVCDLFLDTPECNAHTTAADVLWSGTPLLTYGRHEHKMCSRMAGSIIRGALPKTPEGDKVAEQLITSSEEEYEKTAISLLQNTHYDDEGMLQGGLAEIRKMLYTTRTSAGLFDTKRWVRDLEDACWLAWDRWVKGVSGDIWLKDEPVGVPHLTSNRSAVKQPASQEDDERDPSLTKDGAVLASAEVAPDLAPALTPTAVAVADDGTADLLKVVDQAFMSTSIVPSLTEEEQGLWSTPSA